MCKKRLTCKMKSSLNNLFVFDIPILIIYSRRSRMIYILQTYCICVVFSNLKIDSAMVHFNFLQWFQLFAMSASYANWFEQHIFGVYICVLDIRHKHTNTLASWLQMFKYKFIFTLTVFYSLSDRPIWYYSQYQPSVSIKGLRRHQFPSMA